MDTAVIDGGAGLTGGDSGILLRVRELGAGEFPRLRSLRDLPSLHEGVDPNTARVVVGEDEMGRIKALWIVHAAVHIEPFWIAEEHRCHPGLIRSLWRKVHEILQATGQKISYAIFEEGSTALPLALRLGFQPMAGQLFLVTLPSPERRA